MASSLNWVWLTVYGVIFLSHVRCVVDRCDLHRDWHAAHCVMAIAMADMFLPGRWQIVPETVWQTVFGVTLVLIVSRVARAEIKFGPSRLVWTLTGVDMAAMVYMTMFPSAANQLISYALVGYFALEAGAWIAGRIAVDSPKIRSGLLATARYEPAETAENVFGSSGIACPIEHRIVLGAMSAGMAYMLMAMLAGT